ncbi:unnamed protein product [Bursaphelenchus xylophilus]|uniref:(pine wood nematode) hypothetical protein n=1 Tax=Bursaphelenchus xylophilus TaxID=6326 RepID=A0A1I7RRJ1_BURXY|nr:unnamed protein product [Bursaphelenchus xylophilus]CAG9131075.1 unnamed protein product [Bursaphelenchus xylophilus]
MPLNRDEYRQGAIIGEGAYGKVYAVTHRATDLRMVMKVARIRPEDDGIPQALLREISICALLKKMNHPNLARFIDAFITESNHQYIRIVFERCDFDLSRYLHELPMNMGEAQCKYLSVQLLRGVDFLHSYGILHRDIKPQNILVNRDHQVKITDFGLSRTYSLHTTFTSKTVTLWYRCPEVLLQCKYNTAVDIWSTACVIAELMNRTALFPANTEASMLKLIFQTIGTPSAAIWPLDAIVDVNCFEKYAPRPMRDLVPRMSLPGQHLLSAMLSFLPYERPTAQECLGSDYFKGM